MIADESVHEDGRISRARALREKRRAEILVAARRVFAEKGYYSGSITDIIEAARVARGTFYLYFESKRAIFEVIVDDLLTELRGRIQKVDLASDESPEQQLFGIVRRVLELFAENDDLTRILLQQAMGLDREFDQKLDDFYQSVLGMIRSSLEWGLRLEILRPLNPHTTACFILGSVKEAMRIALIARDPQLADLDTLVRDILQYNLHGLFRDTPA